MVGLENSYFYRSNLERMHANILNLVNFGMDWAIFLEPFAYTLLKVHDENTTDMKSSKISR